LAAGNIPDRLRRYGAVVPVYRRMRKNLKDVTMIYLTAAVSLFLFVYLFAALIRPEWF
jgi:K+-transporting ATPase KdpF subunit